MSLGKENSMAEKVREFKGGPGARGRGPRPKVSNPGKLFKRIMQYVMRKYTVHIAVVVICIFVGVLANVRGTLFMQTLIDDYILPMMGSADPDFGPLLAAMARVAVFYAIGALSTWVYSRIMVNVTQGTLRDLRQDLFSNMEGLPIKFFDTHAHGDIMSIYTNDIDTLRQMISQSMPQLLNSVITVVSVFISMIVLNVPLTVVTLIMVAVTLTSTKAIASRRILVRSTDILKK